MIDELTVLRDARPHTEDPAPANVLRARRALLRHALAPRLSQRRRVARWAVAGVAAAAVLTAVGIVDLDGGHEGATAAAATVLNASAGRIDAVPVPGPGEFRYVRTIQTSWFHGPRSKAPGAPARTFSETHTYESWVPGEADQPWISRYTDSGPSDAPGNGSRSTERLASQRPAWYGTEATGSALLDILRDDPRGGELHGDAAIWENAGQTLLDPLASVELKAAVLRALTGLDGVRVVDQRAALGNGRHGIALGMTGDTLQFIFSATGTRYLGMRTIGGGHGLADAGPDGASNVSYVDEVAVADHAPRPNGVSMNGGTNP